MRYDYKNGNEEVIEREFPIGKAPDEIVVEGCTYSLQLNFGSGGVIVKNGQGFGGTPCSTWPRTSNAMGVAAEQVRDQMKEDRRKGVPTDYTPTGEPILTSKGHQDRYMKAHGFYDRGGAMGAAEAKKKKDASRKRSIQE